MSIPVEIGDLEGALADFGSGYLLTTSDGRVKVVTVDPTYDDGALAIPGPGRGTLANLAANPTVTLVFPPAESKGYSLLLDGTGAVEGEDVRISPASAVLHRPRSHADALRGSHARTSGQAELPPNGCGHDCAPV